MLCDKRIADLVDHGNILGVLESVPRLAAESPIQAASLDLHIGGIYLPSAGPNDAGGSLAPSQNTYCRPAKLSWSVPASCSICLVTLAESLFADFELIKLEDVTPLVRVRS